jgi:hypothetical protein
MSPGSSKKVGITVATIFSPFSKKNLLVCDSVTISHFGSFEPDVGRGASQGSLQDTKETTVALANQRITVICGQSENVAGGGVISHAHRTPRRLVLFVVEVD